MKPMTKVLAWTAFVVVAGLAYAFYSGADPTRAIVLGAGALLMMSLIVFLRWLTWRGTATREFFTADQKAQQAVLEGRLDEARQTYETWRASKVPQIASAAVHLAATLDMRLGRINEAIQLLETRLKTARGPLLPHTTVLLATNHALRNDLEAAKRWLDETPATTPARYQMPVAQLAFARAVVECRSGRRDEAARLLDERWPDIERQLEPHQLRPYRILRAFAGGNANADLADLRPTFAGEHDYLGKVWPEMATFLATNNLSVPKPGV
jgi:hypothetical protein